MEIEKLYDELIRNVRFFTNSINRTNCQEVNIVKDTLNDIIKRVSFLNNIADDTKTTEYRMIKELRTLSKNMIVKTKNRNLYIAKMQRNIDHLTWVNKHRELNLSSRKYTVSQKEIFFACLGDNIGSEQNGRRPVIILQNNVGNENGNTTIVAPVTTHQKRIKWDNSCRKFYVDIVKDGTLKRKYLDFYEVPLRLETNPLGLYGFVNVMHLREIDRKRIDSKCQGIATDKCFENIIKAINMNLS